MHSYPWWIKKIVELPCVPVALSLYDKNIRTRESDANQNSIKKGYAEISIDINSLSEENREILRKNIQNNMSEQLTIRIKRNYHLALRSDWIKIVQ